MKQQLTSMKFRVFENQSVMYNEKHDTGNGKFKQDFEEVPQGIFPFVVGDVEGVQITVLTYLKNTNHTLNVAGTVRKSTTLSKATGHWRQMDYQDRDRLVYQTIPQNFRFEEGKTYKVTFDYEAGSQWSILIRHR